jgi:hypothetical protein
LHRAPPNPNDVKINVEGAFIVDDESPCPEAKNGTADEGVYFENKDIRLPYHTAVVSHVAVDVQSPLSIGSETAHLFCDRLEDPSPKLSTSLENRTLPTKAAA